jgi:hypothetical protein
MAKTTTQSLVQGKGLNGPPEPWVESGFARVAFRCRSIKLRL